MVHMVVHFQSVENSRRHEIDIAFAAKRIALRILRRMVDFAGQFDFRDIEFVAHGKKRIPRHTFISEIFSKLYEQPLYPGNSYRGRYR